MINWQNKDPITECKKIKLRKYAMADAAVCIPKESLLSDTENEIHGLAQKHINEIKKIGLKFFGQLEPEINELKTRITFAKESYNETFQKLDLAIKALLNKFDLEIQNQKRNFHELKDEFDLFKTQNHLERPANPANFFKFILFIGIIAILFLLEVKVNSEIAGQAFSGGRAQGETISRAVAGLNVFLSFLIGFYAVKQIFHSHPGNKLVGKIILVLYIPFVTYINFSFGALRALSAQFSQSGADYEESDSGDNNIIDNPEFGNMADNIPQTFEEMKSLSLMPWDGRIPWDYESFVLVAIGLAFGLFSVLDGFHFDDKYPGYGSVARKKNNARKKIEKSYQKLNETKDKIIQMYSKILSEQKTGFSNDISKWSIKTNQFENEIKAYDVSLSSGEVAYTHMIRQYMIHNMNYRPKKCPAPDRLKKSTDENTLLFKYPKDDYARVVFKQHLDVYLDDDERGKVTKDFSLNAKNEFTNSNEKIADYANKLKKRIQEEHDELEKIF